MVELGLVEQRLKAVHEVLYGATAVDVAERLWGSETPSCLVVLRFGIR